MIPRNKIVSEKEKIYKNCQTDGCGGGSCVSCAKAASRIELYADAHIPVKYWGLSFKDFNGDKRFAEKFRTILKDVDSFYSDGKSIILTGSLGVGKTYSISCLLKLAATKDYTCYYTTMSDVISSAISNQTFLEEVKSVDFLAIDELDPRWIFPSEKSEQLFGSTMEHLLRTRFQNCLPTIIASNADNVDAIFNSAFGKTFTSLRSGFADIYIIGGVDFRRKNVS